MSQADSATSTLPKGLPLLGRVDLSGLAELTVPIAVLATVIALITPVPPIVLDFLLALDIMLSVVVLMVSLHINRPVDFSVFPTTLLLLTLFRLTLNISATRLILMNGSSGTRAAGSVIESFGNFVVGGNYVIGAVIFLMLIAIQYVVINHGAVRISEVTARFTLDALPGKQMSIDSDLSAGLIDESEALKRRKLLAKEAEFYGAMDGASRFTQRDALASTLTTGINILGGLLIGIFQHGMDFRRALETYTVLTIGDGLVTVIPALMVSISGGLIVTRTSSEELVSRDIRKQVFGASTPLLLSGGVLLVLSTFPGLPKAPFLVVGAGLAVVGYRMRKRRETLPAAPPPKPADAREHLESLLQVEPLVVEVGCGLIPYLQDGPQAPLLAKVAAIRRQVASEMGFLVPSIRFTDNTALRTQEYIVRLKGIEIARYDLPPQKDLAIASPQVEEEVQGSPTEEPAFGMPALWIPPTLATRARSYGYTVIDSLSVLATHLLEVVRRHAHELYSRQEARRLLDRVAMESPKVVEDLVPKLLPLAVVHRVFQNLLRERVSIRDATSILEALGEAALTTRNPVLLTEYTRQAIRRTVVSPYLNPGGGLPAFFLDPGLEESVASTVQHGEHASQMAVPPQTVRQILTAISKTVGKPQAPVVIIASTAARFFLQQMVEATIPNVYFLSHSEVPPGTKVLSLGVIQ
jgi:flagellar biosynthesis protein FlhA